MITLMKLMLFLAHSRSTKRVKRLLEFITEHFQLGGILKFLKCESSKEKTTQFSNWLTHMLISSVPKNLT